MREIVYAVLIVAVVMGAASVATAQPGDGGFGEGSGVGGGGQMGEQTTAADVVYVRENGDAVLVYESQSTGSSDASVSYGADMSSGLMHFLVNGTAENTDLTGDLSFVAEPASLSANGGFETGEIEAIEEMSLDVSSQIDDTNSETTAELDATVSSSAAAAVSAASTGGDIVAGPDTLTSSGSASFETALGGSSVREVNSFSLSGTGGDYTLEARERRTVRGELTPASGPGGNNPTLGSTEPVEIWGTREKAREKLLERYAGFAENVSGSVDLTLESYSFENVSTETQFGTTRNESLIDVEYTVEYTGVTDGLADSITEEDPGISEETAEETAQAISNINVNSLEFTTVSEGGSTDTNWTVDIENYNDATLAYFRLSSEMTPGTGMGGGPGMGPGMGPGAGPAPGANFSEDIFEDLIQRSEEQMAAAEASNFTSRIEWSGSIESEGAGTGTGAGPGPSTGPGGSGPTASVSAEMTRTTENWESYVGELENRDLPTPVDTSFDLQVSSADGGLEGEMSWEASGESLYEGYSETMDVYESMLEESEDVDADVLRDLTSSGFRIAKMDASIGEGGWSVEAGASFDNGTALASAIEATEGIRVTEMVGEQEEGGVMTYVKTEGFVEETTEDTVRSREQVGEETTVNLPGDWDRDFPEMDRQAAADYLGVELEDEGGDESPLPGFSFVAALVALTVVAVAVAVRRRRENE